MKNVFIDLDNTLAANETCDNVDFTPGLYLNKKPIHIVIDAIKYLYEQENLTIISVYSGGWDGRQEKIEWMRKNLPNCMIKNAPILIDYKDYRTKADFIKDYAFMNNIDLNDCIIIDDKKKILQECKNIGIKALYPQQIICMYEEFKVMIEND